MHDLNINPDTFCATPFVDVRISPDGSMHFCYVSGLHNNKDTDNIQRMTVDQYFNSSDAVLDIRNRMKNGLDHYVCEGCYKCEQANNISYRQKRNINFAIFPKQDFEPSVKESTLWDLDLGKPRYYHVSFSNLCNMACMMCHPRYSSLLTTTFKKINLVSEDTPVLQDWTQGPAWNQFCEHLVNNPHIFFLHIMGGEPMFHKKFKELLITLNEKKHTDFHFSFVTNGSVYDPEVTELLKNFRSVAVEISIENPGTINTYVRHNSNTQQIVSNIEQWAQHQSPTFNVILRPLPQALTVVNYDQLLDFALTRGLGIDSHLLENPEFMRVNILPDNIKHAIKQKIEKKFLHDFEPSVYDINHRNLTSVVDSIKIDAQRVLNQLDMPCHDIEQKRQQFVDYCVKFDQARGYHIKDYVPELLDFVNHYGYGQHFS